MEKPKVLEKYGYYRYKQIPMVFIANLIQSNCKLDMMRLSTSLSTTELDLHVVID